MEETTVYVDIETPAMDTVPVAPTELPPASQLTEFGVTLGTPAGLNLVLGVWGVQSLPIVARISGGFFGNDLSGIQLELGFRLSHTRNFRHALSLGFVHTEANFLFTKMNWTGIGPLYVLNWGGFSFQTGLTFGSGESKDTLDLFSTTTPDPPKPISSPRLVLSLGYTYMW